jgi:16S rRNA (cytosine967-C5)-methyltransferase
MSAQPYKSARALAAEVLQRFDPQRDYAGALLDPLLDQTRERQRATDLVYGTIRNLHALDVVIARFSGRLPARIAPNLLSLLHVGVYELVYSPAAPVYSIVDEAVTQAGRAGGKRQTGFVNAVLRQVVRHITNRQADLAAAAPRRTLVQTATAGCEFDTDFLPDPNASLPAYLATCFSLPAWLVTQWVADFGPEQARHICLACRRRPSLYVRVNPLRTTARDLLTRFEQAGVQAEAVPVGWATPTVPVGASRTEGDAEVGGAEEQSVVGTAHPTREDSGRPSDMIKVAGPHSVTQLPGFSEGLFTVQDLAAAQVVPALAPQPGWSILDLCAAPGTKTTQLAELTREAARITATDIDPGRLELVRENIARLGLQSVTVVPYAETEQGGGAAFDAVLLDAPCSNAGVLARRVEARFRITPQAIEGLAATQGQLLAKAAGLVTSGGRICYATCSVQRAENQQVVQDFLSRHEFELVREKLLLPAAEPFDHDGAYVAVLRRK